MREIKFRFWDKHTKEMHEVGQIVFKVKHGMTSTDLADYVMNPYGSRYLTVGEDVELMQYTGLKDKHGKGIFEGDILCVEDESRGTVKFGKGCFYYDNWIDGLTALEDINTESNAIVIGNVYEHPELLKEG